MSRGRASKITSYITWVFTGRYMGKAFIVSGLLLILPIVFMAMLAPLISPYDPTAMVGQPLSPPCPRFPFGSDNLGRDILSRVIWGSRVVLLVVLTSTALAASIGIPLGLLSGYIGGKIDRVLSMIMDSMYAFPGLILAIALASVLGPSIINAALAIAVVYIPIYFRMTRGPTLQIKENIYIEAARAAGSPAKWIMFKHILPNVVPTLSVVLTLNMADAILTEAGLSFLGFVVVPPTPDWGFDLRAGQPYLPAGYWWPITFPGLFILLLSLGFGLIGEGLNDMLATKEL